jgi:hypothetical protein
MGRNSVGGLNATDGALADKNDHSSTSKSGCSYIMQSTIGSRMFSNSVHEILIEARGAFP